MLLSSLCVAQRKKSNKRTKKNKMTLKQSNEFMKKVDKIKMQKLLSRFTCGTSM